MKYEAKENHSRWRNSLLNITYYKLRAGKHFGYYIIGLGNKDYGVGSAGEILDQALMIPRVRHGWENHGEETEVCGPNRLAQQPTPWRHHDERHAKRPP